MSQEEATVTCENCEKHIPESKSFLHEAYCFRNIIRCPKCNEPVNKTEMEQHEDEYHKLKNCKYCHKGFEANKLVFHVENCMEKPVLCQFCNTDVSRSEYSDHAYQCGSRTRKCQFCNSNILVRELEDHEAVCQVQQLTRDQNHGEAFYNDDDYGNRGSRNQAISKRRQELPKKQEIPKKKLTKYSDMGNPALQRGKTQEEIDEEMAATMNDEYFLGRNKANQKKTQEELDEEMARELNREHLGPVPTTKPDGSRVTIEDRIKQMDEEFFGFKKGNKPKGSKLDIEKHDKPKPEKIDVEDEDYARRLQEEFDRANQPAPVSKTRNVNKPKPAYVEPEYEEPDYSYEYNQNDYTEQTGQQSEQIDHDLQQFMGEGEDAELQRAIQASLQGYK